MIMKLVSFFVLSVAVHASALVYPVSFGGQKDTQPIQVTILPIEQESLGSAGGHGNPAPQSAAKAPTRKPPAAAPKIESKKPSESPKPQTFANEAAPSTSQSGIALFSPPANSVQDPDTAVADSISNGEPGSGPRNAGTGSGGNGAGSSGAGFGSGSSQASSESGVVLTQARYRDTPRPDYPDSARREGREGRVLLRVLVDDQGRSRQVEVNSSSGSDVLDRAATEAIKRWRFHPARYGDKPVESWLRIPIEFRLADAKPW